MSNQVNLGQPSNGGMPGRDGNDGASAYELAVANGFTGTLSEWLTDLGTNVAGNVTNLMDFRATWDPTAPNAPGYGGSYQSLKDLVDATPDGAVVTVDMVGTVAYSLAEFVDVNKRMVQIIGNGATVTIPTKLFGTTVNTYSGGFLANGGKVDFSNINWVFGAELPGTTTWWEPCSIIEGVAPSALFRNCTFTSQSLLVNRVAVCLQGKKCSSNIEVTGCTFTGLMSITAALNGDSSGAILRGSVLTFSSGAVIARLGRLLMAPGSTLRADKFISNLG